MSAADWLERLGNMAHALRRREADDARGRWSRDELRAYQRARLRDLVRHATTRSPLYRELYGGVIDRDVELGELPPLAKDVMMARFDEVVTDPRLRLAPLLAHAQTLRGDERYLGDFRVMTSSGSSGRKAVYVYDRRAWREGFLPQSLRMSRLAGLRPGLPRPRIATVAAGDGKHMTFRGGASMDVGLFVTRRISAARPLAEQVAELEAYRPDFLVGYPSALALLADEQRAGRLRIAPRSVTTSSEVRTAAMAASIRAAWGVEPFNCLGLTETGIAAMDCAAHRGLHVFEDFTIIEVVDERGRPVPDGTVGAKILVTNLFNRVQPILRFEVSDLVALDAAPCPCGLTFQRVVALDGRSDDILELPGPRGPVRVHPILVRGALGAEPAVLAYQVVQERGALDVQLVLAAGAGEATIARVSAALEAALRAAGAGVPVGVRAVAAIAREEGAGKLKLIRAAATASSRAHP